MKLPEKAQEFNLEKNLHGVLYEFVSRNKIINQFFVIFLDKSGNVEMFKRNICINATGVGGHKINKRENGKCKSSVKIWLFSFYSPNQIFDMSQQAVSAAII
jgi:hypothetical protein